MRYVFTISLLALIHHSKAQDLFSSQLKMIIEESKQGFVKLRGPVKRISHTTDTTYDSNIQLEGTLRNEISIYKREEALGSDTNELESKFLALIDSTLDAKFANNTLLDWKQKVKNVLGDTYVLRESLQNYRGEGFRTFIFRKENTQIIVGYSYWKINTSTLFKISFIVFGRTK
jgi:hypothetical protein